MGDVAAVICQSQFDLLALIQKQDQKASRGQKKIAWDEDEGSNEYYCDSSTNKNCFPVVPEKNVQLKWMIRFFRRNMKLHHQGTQ